jgi:hypothetical protein
MVALGFVMYASLRCRGCWSQPLFQKKEKNMQQSQKLNHSHILSSNFVNNLDDVINVMPPKNPLYIAFSIE